MTYLASKVNKLRENFDSLKILSYCKEDFSLLDNNWGFEATNCGIRCLIDRLNHFVDLKKGKLAF